MGIGQPTAWALTSNARPSPAVILGVEDRDPSAEVWRLVDW